MKKLVLALLTCVALVGCSATPVQQDCLNLAAAECALQYDPVKDQAHFKPCLAAALLQCAAPAPTPSPTPVAPVK